MHVFGNGVEIREGADASLADHTDFGVINCGASLTRTFTITNMGTTAMTLFSPPIRNVSAPFMVLVEPALTVPAHGSTTFTIRFSGDGLAPGTSRYAGARIFGILGGGYDPYFEFTIKASTGSPVIELSGLGQSIVNGDVTPDAMDGTDFGDVLLNGSTATNTYTIRNTGNLPLTGLTWPFVQILGAAAGDFTVTRDPQVPVAPGTSTTFRVVFDPSAAGTRRATVTIPNNAYGQNPFTFDLTGVGAVPEMDVRGNNVSITSGDTTPNGADNTDFGNVPIGHTVERVFRVYNLGGAPLAFTDLVRVQVSGPQASEFTVKQQLPETVPGHGQASFTISFNPSTGYRQATVSVANTDADENPYTFSIAGTGVAPETDVKGNGTSIADGDATPRTADHTDFGSVLALSPLTRTFTIFNTGTGDLDLPGTPRVSLLAGTNQFRVTQYPVTPVTPGTSTTFQVTFVPWDAGVYSNTVRIVNTDPDEDPYTFAIRGTGTRPVAVVRGKGVTIADDDTTPSKADDTDYGCVPLGVTVYRTYTVANTGTIGLSFTNAPRVRFTGPAAAEFALAAAPASPVAVGGSTTFRVAFTPRAGGYRAATVVIPDNDPVNPSYAFAVRGLAAEPLTNGVPSAVGTLTNAFTFGLTTDSWHSVSCYSALGHFDLNVYSSTSRTEMLDMSTSQMPDNPDFVVLNGRALGAAPCTACAVVYGTAPHAACNVKAERAAPAIDVNRLYTGCRLDAADPADLYEVQLDAGRTYRIRVQPVSAAAGQAAGDLGFYLFNPEMSTGIPSSFDIHVDNLGTGGAESFSYAAMTSGRYALLVIRRGNPTGYELSVMTGPLPRVQGNGLTVVNGDTTPTTEDGTAFAAGDVSGAATLHAFNLFNLGVGDLILTNAPPRVRFTGTDAASFGIGTMPGRTIVPDLYTTFTLGFVPRHSGPCTATAVIGSNEILTPTYQFAVQGMGFHRLADDAPAPTALTAVPEYLTFDASGTQWSAVGVKSPLQNRELRLARDPSFADWNLDSKAAGTLTEFVAVESTKTTNWYVRVSGGTVTNYSAQMCRPATNLAAGVAQAGFMGAADVLAAYRADWTAGTTYYVAVDPLPDSPAKQNLSLFVLRPGRSYGSRTAADAGADASGTNARESLTLTATQTGTYLVLVVNETSTPATKWSVVAAPAVPDMGVLGNSQPIPSGSTLLSVTNNTRFPMLSTAVACTNTFTIRNAGYATLQLNGTPRVQFDGANPQDFTATTLPAASVPLRGAGTTTFAIAFHPRGRGARSARVVIPSNQGAAYTFAVGGTATGPSMEVESWATGAPVPHGSVAPLVTNDTDFLDFTPGGPWAHTNMFLIHNVGEDWLNFTNNPRAVVAGPQAGDFRVIVGGASVLPGESIDLRVAFQPTAVGLRQATVRIPSSDPAHDPFEFAVQGTGVLPRLTKLEDVGGGWFRLYWQSIANVQYDVYRTDSLARGFTGVVTRLTGATPPTNAVYIEPAAAGKPLYLRVKVGRQR